MWFFASSLGEVVGLMVSIILLPFLIWPVMGVVRDMWQVPMAVMLSPKIGFAVVATVILTTFFVSGRVLGLDHIGGRLLLAAAFGARPALWSIRHLAWRLAPTALRSEAASICNELATRLQERPVDPGHSWPTFVFDIERARRRAAYEPPPI